MNEKPHGSKWLELLQQESWQLELIISGFAIFLVGSLFEPITTFGLEINVISQGIENNFLISVPYMVVFGAWFFLLVNLILHVIFRGLWISTIGLRYVSGDIDFDALKLHPKFDKYIRKNTTDYDEYIERLEKACSVVFAFTFMIIFMLIAFGLWGMGLYFLIDIVCQKFIASFTSENFADILSLIIGTIWFLGGLLYLIDFVSLGWLKRKKWASKIYYPIYRTFNIITLAFIYRPIYYNLIDNKFSKKFAYFLVPYVIILVVLVSIETVHHPYFPDKSYERRLYHNVYDDERNDGKWVISSVSIPSKYLSNGFLEVFINYNSRLHDNVIQEICPDLKPLVSTGFRPSIIQIDLDDADVSSPDSALACVSQLYKIHINDSLFEEPNYYFYAHEAHAEKGILTILDLNYLPRGKHTLKVERQRILKDTLEWKTWAEFPFWKE